MNTDELSTKNETEALNKHSVSIRSHRAYAKCAKWLAYCLEIGWNKSQLDALEKLWWEHHNCRTGEVVRNGC